MVKEKMKKKKEMKDYKYVLYLLLSFFISFPIPISLHFLHILSGYHHFPSFILFKHAIHYQNIIITVSYILSALITINYFKENE